MNDCLCLCCIMYVDHKTFLSNKNTEHCPTCLVLEVHGVLVDDALGDVVEAGGLDPVQRLRLVRAEVERHLGRHHGQARQHQQQGCHRRHPEAPPSPSLSTCPLSPPHLHRDDRRCVPAPPLFQHNQELFLSCSNTAPNTMQTLSSLRTRGQGSVLSK